VFIAADGNARSARRGDVSQVVASGRAVRALLLTGDSLWIGSDAGLAVLRATTPDSEPRRAAAARSDSRFTRPVRALARSDSILVVVTDRDLLAINAHSGQPVRAFDAVDAGVVRAVNAMAMDDRTLWVAGDAGVLVVSRASGVSRLLTAPTAVPGETYDVVLDAAFAWIASSGGVLRVRRLPDGGVR
jgi:hypothetical protein